uniref:Uncharacterized protein n=1 Tax=Anopheles farauti TaxID=69004 RepID=A0A182Q2U7_9DIPT
MDKNEESKSQPEKEECKDGSCNSCWMKVAGYGPKQPPMVITVSASEEKQPQGAQRCRLIDVPSTTLDQLVVVLFALDAEVLVLRVRKLTLEVFEQDQQLVLAARHQRVDVLQPEPVLTVAEVAETELVVIPGPEERLRTVEPVLDHRPSVLPEVEAAQHILYTPVFTMRLSWQELYTISSSSSSGGESVDDLTGPSDSIRFSFVMRCTASALARLERGHDDMGGKKRFTKSANKKVNLHLQQLVERTHHHQHLLAQLLQLLHDQPAVALIILVLQPPTVRLERIAESVHR